MEPPFRISRTLRFFIGTIYKYHHGGFPTTIGRASIGHGSKLSDTFHPILVHGHTLSESSRVTQLDLTADLESDSLLHEPLAIDLNNNNDISAAARGKTIAEITDDASG